MKANLTIIILTYNSSHVIKNCLSNLNCDKYKVVVVDNASKDNTVELVKADFPKVQLIQLAKNFGYGRGNNVALRQVETEFALVLNPDALISEDSIDVVLQEIIVNEKVAVAGPLILTQASISDEAINIAKAKIEKDFSTIRDIYYKKVGNGFDSRFISGACIFLRMHVFQKLGFFDEKIFLFYEDDEICLRTKRNGYENLTVPQAVVCHVGGSSSKKTLREIYRRDWHLKGWSKLYWKKVRRGKFSAKKSSLRLTCYYFIRFLTSLIKLDSEAAAKNIGACAGSLSFLVGFDSFKKDNTPRG